MSRQNKESSFCPDTTSNCFDLMGAEVQQGLRMNGNAHRSGTFPRREINIFRQKQQEVRVQRDSKNDLGDNSIVQSLINSNPNS